MAQQQPSPEQLRLILTNTLSPDSNVRRAAEQQLNDAVKLPGHPLQVLRIVASNEGVDAPVRQAAAVHFKNVVKKSWKVDEENGSTNAVIAASDRDLIKSNLVELMCTVPHQIQAQCSEAISIIAAVDFPEKWNNLLPELVRKFDSPDPAIVQGVLLTINSIIKRFRYVQRSDELYKDILYVLERLQAPLLTLFKATGQTVEALANDANQLKPRFASLRLMCRIFYSLNWQDLPEFFEDHMAEWMEEFAKYLQYQNPVLTDDDEENEPSPIDNLQTAIVANLDLYADKDEEPFLPFLPNFTTLVWNLLLRVSALPKHDRLATICIRFLSSLVGKQMHRALFQDEATLRQIISNIVVPNLMIREVDEERFEDDPQEFILSDMEGSETQTRRKCSQVLLRAMCRQFEAETTSICLEHMQSMLSEFSVDPASKWAAKDVAIHLMLGISIRAESAQGVSAVNDKVNILEFFTSYIVPELQESNQSLRPMVKATAIKFVSTFRNQFTKEHLTALMQLLIAHLSSPSIVIHTYAAAAIEKILTVREEGADGVKRAKFGREEIKPFLEPLFTGLFTVVDNPVLNENEYMMKCVMRSLNVARQEIASVTQTVIEKLTAVLGRVAKNPRNPQFNHYLFESIAVLILSVCSKDPAHTSAFESLLFPPFQTVLQLDVAEFTPYVFQVLAQLLEYRPSDSGLGPAYSMLFPPLLTPTLWERKGNIPALTRLLQAYIKKSPNELVTGGHLPGILGVFQKLVSSRANEVNAFDLLEALTSYMPRDAMQPSMMDLNKILMVRLQKGKTGRYVRLVTRYFALFIGKYGAQMYLDLLNSVQPGLGLMLLMQVWLPRLQSDAPVRMEAKIQVVGLTKLLCDTPALLADANGQQIWAQTLGAIMNILTSAESSFGVVKTDANDDNGDFEVEIGYDATFSRLHFAARPVSDPFPEVNDPSLMLVHSLQKLGASQPGKLPNLIQQGLKSDPKLSAGLESLVKKAGVNLG